MIDFSKMKTAEQKQAEKEQAELDRVNAEARKYLSDTDWYITRFYETGVAVPEDVLSARQAAREQVQ